MKLGLEVFILKLRFQKSISMLISLIIKENFIYVNLHAEQTISSSYFGANIGIHISELFDSTLKRLSEGLDSIENSNNYILYLDFEGIENAGKHLFDDFIEINKKVKNIAFINLKNSVLKQLNLNDDYLNNPKNDINEIVDKFNMFYFGTSLNSIKSINPEVVFEEELLEFIEYFTNKLDKPHLHESSSVYLTTYIDIKKMISEGTSFFMYCLYKLALKIKANWDIVNSDKPRLVCQNLNSSFISSILSNFLQLDIVILDHVGPINTLYSTLSNKIEDSRNYIIVSDMVCLGTEVKITKNLISFLGGKVIGNVSIVKLNTYYPEDLDSDKIKNISVFNINKENNTKINFKIKTALD
jgi:hypothetical protein